MFSQKFKTTKLLYSLKSYQLLHKEWRMDFLKFVTSPSTKCLKSCAKLLSGLPWWRSGWESACRCGGRGFEPWSGRIPHAAERLGPWATIEKKQKNKKTVINLFLTLKWIKIFFTDSLQIWQLNLSDYSALIATSWGTPPNNVHSKMAKGT